MAAVGYAETKSAQISTAANTRISQGFLSLSVRIWAVTFLDRAR